MAYTNSHQCCLVELEHGPHSIPARTAFWSRHGHKVKGLGEGEEEVPLFSQDLTTLGPEAQRHEALHRLLSIANCDLRMERFLEDNAYAADFFHNQMKTATDGGAELYWTATQDPNNLLDADPPSDRAGYAIYMARHESRYAWLAKRSTMVYRAHHSFTRYVEVFV